MEKYEHGGAIPPECGARAEHDERETVGPIRITNAVDPSLLFRFLASNIAEDAVLAGMLRKVVRRT